MRFLKPVKLLSAVLAVLLLSGCAMWGAEGGTEPSESRNAGGDLFCLEISRFSGSFVEDGSDEPVEDVAAILVSNETDEYLELATVTYFVGNRTATFQVTGLPAGERAWVLEKDRMRVSAADEFVFDDCTVTYNPRAIRETDALSLQRQGNSVTITNTSDKTLKHVCVYYKNRMEDGAYFGGITYLISFGELMPGESAQRSVAHFGDDSQIVRYGYQSE